MDKMKAYCVVVMHPNKPTGFGVFEDPEDDTYTKEITLDSDEAYHLAAELAVHYNKEGYSYRVVGFEI